MSLIGNLVEDSTRLALLIYELDWRMNLYHFRKVIALFGWYSLVLFMFMEFGSIHIPV